MVRKHVENVVCVNLCFQTLRIDRKWSAVMFCLVPWHGVLLCVVVWDNVVLSDLVALPDVVLRVRGCCDRA